MVNREVDSLVDLPGREWTLQKCKKLDRDIGKIKKNVFKDFRTLIA